MFQRNGIPQSRLDFLRQVPLFHGLSDKVLARVDSLLVEASVEPGRVLTKQGGGSFEAFIVADGTAEVCVNDEVVGEAGAGELIGELGVLDRTARTATVTARTPMTLLVLNPGELQTLIDDESLAARIRQNVDRHHAGPQP